MGAGACFSEQNDFEPHRRLQDPSVGLRAGTGPPGRVCGAPSPKPGLASLISFLGLAGTCCCSWCLSAFSRVIKLKWLFGLGMFSVRTFSRAEKEMGSLGKTHGLVPGKHNCGAVGRKKE